MSRKTENRTAVITGAAGFAGINLVVHLLLHGYKVYAVVRPGSGHNVRLKTDNLRMICDIELKRGFVKQNGPDIVLEKISDNLSCVELDYTEYDKLPVRINDKCDIFFHLAWSGGRDDFKEQTANIKASIDAVEAAEALSCSRFVCTGSQAEYGVQEDLISEDICPDPINAYGAAKTAAMYLTRRRAEQSGIVLLESLIIQIE